MKKKVFIVAVILFTACIILSRIFSIRKFAVIIGESDTIAKISRRFRMKSEETILFIQDRKKIPKMTFLSELSNFFNDNEDYQQYFISLPDDNYLSENNMEEITFYMLVPILEKNFNIRIIYLKYNFKSNVREIDQFSSEKPIFVISNKKEEKRLNQNEKD